MARVGPLPITVIQWYMVIVEMPKESEEQGFTVWGTVGRVQASGQNDAIQKACQQAADRLTDVVPSGVMKFHAIPTRDIPAIRAEVTPKEFQTA